MVKKIGKKKRKSQHNMMKPYVDFISLSAALAEANQEDIKDGSKIDENKVFTDKNQLFADRQMLVKPSQLNRYNGRDTSTGEYTETNNPSSLTRQQENFIKIKGLMDTSEYYEVDPIIGRHLQETDPLPVADSEFKLPFGRCFFSTNLKSELGKITGVLVNRCSFYIVKENNTYTLSHENTETCTCGKYKYEHAGISNHGAAEDCERFTWDGNKVAQEVDGYAIYYRWDYKGEMYIKDSLVAFPQDGIGQALLNDSITTQTIKDFLVNLSFYLTVPERVYVKKQRDAQRRLKRNRVPLPSSTYITCNNKMKIYLNKYDEAITEGGKAVQKHRRRGHWRKYSHKKFKNVKTVELADGSMGKYVWVRPTVVGSGMYLPRHRRVQK